MNTDNQVSKETEDLNNFVQELTKDFRVKPINFSFTKPGKMDTYYYEITDEENITQKVLIMHSRELESDLVQNNIKYTTGAINGLIKKELSDQGINIDQLDNLLFTNIHCENYNLGMSVAVEFTISLVTGLLGAQVQQHKLVISNVFPSEDIKDKMNGMLGIISRTFGLTSVKYTIKSVSLEEVRQGSNLVNLDYFHKATQGSNVPVLVSNN
jgi:hypothetical protein